RGEEKQRIVAEASRAAGRFGDPSRAVTVGGQLSAVGEDQHDRRAKPCTALRADPSAKLVEEAAVAIGGVCPVASGMDAWCAAESIDLQARIVCQGRGADRCEQRTGLDSRAFSIARAAFARTAILLGGRHEPQTSAGQ